MKRRGGSLSRMTDRRDPRPTCVIFCEGKNTEPAYLEAFRTKYPRCLFRMELVGAAGTPAVLLEKALVEKRRINRADRKGDSFEGHDVVWIVFDEDDHPHVKQTIDNGRANGIGIAYSNPCFELWLILHSCDYGRPDHRHVVQKRCEEILPGYDRQSGKSGDMLSLVECVVDAEKRAAILVQRREEEGAPLSCPCSTMHELTRSLRTLDPTPIPR